MVTEAPKVVPRTEVRRHASDVDFGYNGQGPHIRAPPAIKSASKSVSPVTVRSRGLGRTMPNRKSLLRKPSFLDIDDDDDGMDCGSSVGRGISNGASRTPVNSESFLEFGRESFDTVANVEFV